MKKKILFMAFAFVVSMFIVPNVFAASVSDIKSWGETGTHIKVEGSDNNYTLTLTGEPKQDLIISQGETVTIDLAGHTLTNYTNNNSVITINSGATVTIIDSSNDGKISLKSDDNGTAPVINNAGTLTLENGTIDSTKAGSTGIYNSGTLTVAGGEVKTSVNGAWGLTNVGTATITDGTFTQGNDFSVVLNAGTMTVEGGNFVAADGGSHNSLITNKNDDGTASMTINGGTFDSTGIFYNEDGDSIVITSGNFASDVSEYLADGLVMEQDEDGNFIVVDAPEIPDDNTNSEENNSTTVVNKVIDKTKLDDVPKTGSIYSVLNFMNYLR